MSAPTSLKRPSILPFVLGIAGLTLLTSYAVSSGLFSSKDSGRTAFQSTHSKADEKNLTMIRDIKRQRQALKDSFK